jgi:integrase
MELVFDEEALVLELKARGNRPPTIRKHVSQAKQIVAADKDWTLGKARKFIFTINEKQSESTVNKWIQTFHHLARTQKIPWAKKLKKLKEYNRPKDILAHDEFWEFFNVDTGGKYNVAWRLILMTGARSCEILRLQRRHIDLERRCILIEKDKIGDNRIVFVQEFFVEELTEYLSPFAPKDFLFTYRGKSLSDKSLENDCSKRLHLLGIDKNVTPHSFRHDYITRMASEVSNIIVLKNLVGHRKTSTTEKYYRKNYFLLKKEVPKDPYFADQNVKYALVGERIIKLINIIIDFCKVDDRIDMVEVMKAIVHLQKAVVKSTQIAQNVATC